jgi:multisubunit Na+/H+ antiporter MnhC subunit
MIEVTLQLLAFIAAASLVIIGLAGLLLLDNMIKKIIAFTLLSDGVNLLLVTVGYVQGGIAAILEPGQSIPEFVDNAILVFPVGIVLTNIVIGVSTTAVSSANTAFLSSTRFAQFPPLFRQTASTEASQGRFRSKNIFFLVQLKIFSAIYPDPLSSR